MVTWKLTDKIFDIFLILFTHNAVNLRECVIVCNQVNQAHIIEFLFNLSIENHDLQTKRYDIIWSYVNVFACAL